MKNKVTANTMTHDSKRELKPQLRFPEFRDAPEWGSHPGDELFESINNKDVPPRLPILAITQEHGAIPRDTIDYHVSVTEKSVDSYKEVKPGDFIISLRSFQGGIEYSQYHGICSPAYVILRRKAEGSDDFFKQFFKSHRFIQQLTKNLEGLRDGKMISYKQFSELLLRVPFPDEQQKIADCLCSLDELIAAHSRKLDALKAYKKGLMQQLFPREGETIPRLRFPDFHDAPEWEENRFGNLLNVSSGKGFKASEYSSFGIQLLQIENVGYGSIKWSGNKNHLPENYIEKYPELILRKGDVVLALNRPITNNELKIARLQKHDEPSFLYQRVGKIEKISDSLTDDFVFPICQNCVREFVIKKSIGSDQPFISLRGLYDQIIHIPSPTEQQKIADCLLRFDDLVSAQIQKLDALHTQKRGLMQQLFPSPEEGEA